MNSIMIDLCKTKINQLIKSYKNIDAHCQEVNSVDFNPFNEYLLLTSSNDKTCALWDLRI